MSYTLAAFAVDLGQLQAVFGSQDQSLLKSIMSEQAAEFVSNDRWFKEDLAPGQPSLREALEQIVTGQLHPVAGSGFQYGYATELLCRHLGIEIPTEELVFVSELEIDTKLLTSGPPLPTPPPDDFPEIGYLTAEQVAEEFVKFSHLGEIESGDDFTPARHEYVNLLDEAKQNHLGLVTFTY
ncbi:MAG: hypothetical protein JSS02_05985 [Planctomycetes bacterium]|nr:hypothetical protein [Planctomycetota bacterium]